MKIIPASIIIGGAFIAGALLYQVPAPKQALAEGVWLPAEWELISQDLVETGVIDEGKYRVRHEVGPTLITRENADYYLNMLWAFGLGTKNRVLSEGPMSDPRYGGPQNFAATGGWTIARGHSMSHFNAHEFIRLTEVEQELVERVAKGIYRPCCPNSAYFPDCNHGMAMLGLIELLASQGLGEEEVERSAHLVNSYWFPEFYEKNNNNNSSSCSVS